MQNKAKWGPYRKKVWPYLQLFGDLIGTSAPTGDHGDCSAVRAHGGSGSSDVPVDPYDEPVNDSSERARFEFQANGHAVPEETVQGFGVDQLGGVEGTSAGAAGTSDRTGGSNKRKSSEATDGFGTRRAKKSIWEKAARDDGNNAAMGQMVQSTQQLVLQNEELIAIQRAKMELCKLQAESQMELNNAKEEAQREVYRQAQRPREIISVLVGFGLTWGQRSIVLKALDSPDERQMFCFANKLEQRSRLAEIISGLYQQWSAGGANGMHQSYMNFFNNL